MAEWVCLVQALFLLPWAALLLRTRGYRFSLQVFSLPDRAQREQIDPQSIQSAKSISRMVDIGARYGVYRANCLCRALVLIRLMHGRGMRGNLLLGARLEGEEFGAHAWVEYGGVGISDGESAGLRYKVFASRTGKSA